MSSLTSSSDASDIVYTFISVGTNNTEVSVSLPLLFAAERTPIDIFSRLILIEFGSFSFATDSFEFVELELSSDIGSNFISCRSFVPRGGNFFEQKLN